MKENIDYQNNLNMNGNEVKNFIVDVVDSLPSDVVEGRIVSLDGDLYIGKDSEYIKLGNANDIAGLDARVDTLETTVGDSSSGLVKAVADNTGDIATLQTTKVTANNAITGATKCKITYDSKGLVTGGANLSASDIPDISATYVKQVQIVTTLAGASDTNIPSEKTVKTALDAKLDDSQLVTTAPTTESSDTTIPSSKAVATAIASAVTGAYKVKGTKTVAQINALTGMVQGDVYNVSDSGTITDGPTVVAGDNVVWDGTKWDKLAGTIDLSGYVPKTTKVNNKALSSDITLGPADVGAISTSYGPKTTIANSDGEIPTSKAVYTGLGGKVDNLSSPATAGTYTKVTIQANGLVSGGTTLAESDIPALSISKTTGLQSALDAKMDDTQLITAWESTTSDAKVPSEKLVKTALDGKVDKVSGKGLSTNDFTNAYKTKLDGIATGAQVNVIETVKVNNVALTPSAKAVNVTVPTKVSDIANDSGYQTASDVVTTLNSYYTKTAVQGFFTSQSITTTGSASAGYTATVNVSAGTPFMAQVFDANGKVVIASITLGASSVMVSTNTSFTGVLKILALPNRGGYPPQTFLFVKGIDNHGGLDSEHHHLGRSNRIGRIDVRSR